MRDQNNFDLMRLAASWSVLFSHCYALAGVPLGEPYLGALGVDTLGGAGVSVFFVLSGYLITDAWLRRKSALQFVFNRLRRIYPALVVCVILTVAVVGPAFTQLDAASYFRHRDTASYLWTMTGWDIRFLLPGVFEMNPLKAAVNGSLWSIKYELMCYLWVFGLGFLPIDARWKSLGVTLVLLGYLSLRPSFNMWEFGAPFHGLDVHTTKVCFLFAFGATVRCWRDWMPIKTWFVFPAAVAFAAAVWLKPHTAIYAPLYLVAFAVLTLWLGVAVKWLPRLPRRMGDWSYGLYLYAFPVQQAAAYLGVHSTYGFTAYVLATTALALVLAAASWYVVERPFLGRERKHRADEPRLATKKG